MILSHFSENTRGERFNELRSSVSGSFACVLYVQSSWRPEEGAESPGTGVDVCEPPRGSQEEQSQNHLFGPLKLLSIIEKKLSLSD